ncbi:MarR family transcriptional regulator [Natrarchaeobius halalkaliphilus]|uniref:MarR family transcriptional regulator n=1 Tax=Natrarchaeobius halalkaliphilus TaxID=1679091 RepID=A0A3N6NZC0_9EURY|nr:helix-turn-helix domain-containing protein [Natrarchaeobius halalkaliphilus]RQG90279.1 MarR family transcriptional regulator [Natrarchaeobius halalkaliphilus]
MNSSVAAEIEISIPQEISSAQAKLVYYYLATNGGGTVDDLHDELDISKGTALSITGTLRDQGHVERIDGRYELV